MRRRIAASALLLAASGVWLAGCDGDLRDTVSSAVPTDGISLPTNLLPTNVLPTDGITLPTVTVDGGGGGAVGQQPGQQPDQQPPPVTATETATATTTASPTQTDETGTTADSGVSPWAWLLLGLVLVAFVVLLVTSARRRRGEAGTALAAQADGKIGWVRSNTDDALVRWRADQLGRSAEQRDIDSELARRWTSLDQRVTAATDDLLALESSVKDSGVRQAASMLRQAVEGYRTSVDALAQSVATGEQARIAAASQALDADTTLLDQARQRLRQAAKL